MELIRNQSASPNPNAARRVVATEESIDGLRETGKSAMADGWPPGPGSEWAVCMSECTGRMRDAAKDRRTLGAGQLHSAWPLE